jgi:DNA-binding transcriptional LysR family regulator
MSLLRISLRQLQVFAAVAEHGSTSAAANVVALSQSATSAALNELERLLGLQVFDRVGKGLVLNAAGRMLLPQAQAVLDGASAIERWAADDGAQLGSLRIGASTTIGSYVLPEVLAGFRAILPASAQAAMQPQVSIANTAAVARAVANFELDLGLIEGPCDEAELVVSPWLEDELLIVASARDAIVPARPDGVVPVEALRAATWLLREPGSGTREIILQALLPVLHELKPGIEFANGEAIKRAAAAGLGIACLSRWAVADLLEAGKLVPVPTDLPRLTRRFFIVRHRHKPLSAGLRRLLDYLENLRPS